MTNETEAILEERIKKLEDKVDLLLEDMLLIKEHYPDPWNRPKPIGSTSDKRV